MAVCIPPWIGFTMKFAWGWAHPNNEALPSENIIASTNPHLFMIYSNEKSISVDEKLKKSEYCIKFEEYMTRGESEENFTVKLL